MLSREVVLQEFVEEKIVEDRGDVRLKDVPETHFKSFILNDMLGGIF